MNGTFTLTGTAAFTTGAFTHTFAGSWVHDSTVATPLVATGSTIAFSAPTPAAATTISGTGTNALAFANVTVSNASGLTLSKPITVVGALNVTGGFTAAAGGTIGVSGTGSVTLGTGATFTNASTLTNSGTGAITVGDGATFTNNDTLTSTSRGSLLIGPTLTATFTNNGTAAVAGTIDGSGQFVNSANATLDITSASAPTVTTFTVSSTGNTVSYTLAGAQGVRAATYRNLTLGGSGSKAASGALTVNGTFTLSGTANFAAGAATHTINGDWANGATASVTSAGLINFSGASATLSGGGTAAFASVTVTSGASLTALANMSTTGTFTVSSGATLTLDPSVTVSGDGTFNLASGGTLGIRAVLGIAAAGASGNVQTTTRTFSTGAHYLYSNSSGSPQLSGTGLPASVASLTITNPNGVTLSTSVAVTGALTLSSGTPGGALSIGSNTLSINGTLSIGTNATLTGGATSSVTVAGSGTGLVLPALTLQQFTMNRADGVTLSGNMSLGGSLTLTSGVVTTGANRIALTGAATTTRTVGHVSGTLEKPLTVALNVDVRGRRRELQPGHPRVRLGHGARHAGGDPGIRRPR